MRHDNTPQEKTSTEKKSLRQDTIEHHVFDDDEHYTTIYNESLQNIRDPIAHAIYHYLRSLPKDWKVIPKQLCNHFSIGRDLVRKKLKYLIEMGYMFYGQNKEGRHWGKGTYLLFRKPLTPEKRAQIEKMFTKTGFQAPQKQAPANTSNTKEIRIQKKKETTTEPKESSAAPPDSSLFSPDKPWIKKVKKEAPEEVEAFISYAKAHKHEADILERWLMACATKKYWRTAAPSPEEKKEKHKKIAKWIVKNYKGPVNVNIGYKYLEFSIGQAYDRVEFGQNNFEEICQKYLQSVNLKMHMFE